MIGGTESRRVEPRAGLRTTSSIGGGVGTGGGGGILRSSDPGRAAETGWGVTRRAEMRSRDSSIDAWWITRSWPVPAGAASDRAMTLGSIDIDG